MHTLYLIAIVAEAMSGALMGMRRGMDRFGLALVGAVTALGGGTVRDVLLGHYPLGWIAHPQYLVITLVAATVASRIARHVARMKTLFVTVDALGLAAFTIIGCDVGASTGAAPIIVVLAGAITGVCGGMLRDLLCNEMPLILRRELYASVAFFTGALYVALQYVGIDARVATVVALAAGFAMRVLAVRFGWEMRTFGAADVEH
ncbi:trimeric intracellular cation channel family protein [Burkholderia multivorans]|uniref:trimeric intracellular cation channel family protein n=1 Tax=Burkholderia TaxID=32008 RepID=UPI001C24CD01|nr:trimeric intracellular cation channel family protein [Burkholderia multivorans]MBU9662897.1 trimeric intracellular cation channel family protein [Burkholderia multivorans]MCA8222681.1 trimeric intracellular cation channel family protein [Burkholderia multivorans]